MQACRKDTAFLTKGFITRPFLELFADHVERVFAQIGITTLDRGLWRRFEPRTAPPHMRVAAIETLIRLGVQTTVRLDPLIPDLTDSDDNLQPLLQSLSQAGIRDAAASYLFLRPQIVNRLEALNTTDVPARAAQASWPYQEFADGSGGGRMLPPSERAQRLTHLRALGDSVGVRIRPCRCKNPELSAEPCGITGPELPACANLPKQTKFSFDGSEAIWDSPNRAIPRPHTPSTARAAVIETAARSVFRVLQRRFCGIFERHDNRPDNRRDR